MFDIGGPELLLIAVMALIVIGPKELPGAIRTVTHWIRKAKGLAAEFRSGLDEMVREAELNEVKDEIRRSIDPGQIGYSIKDDLRDSVDPDGNVKEALSLEGDWYSPDDELYDFVKDDVGDVDKHTAAADAAAKAADETVEPAIADEAAEPVTEEGRAGETDEPADRRSGAGTP